MKRVVIAALLSAVIVGVFAYGTDAQRRRGGHHGRHARHVQQTPQSDAIAPALGDLQWGMGNKQLFSHFRQQIQERYRERLSKARDAMTEDALRHQMSEEVQRIRRSYIRFRGRTSGWDVSFLRDEFTQNNHESMFVVRDGNSQNFYFFINGRLWKWYKAFDASVFQGQTFEQFAEALQGRFGPALERRGRLTDRGEEMHWLEWQDAHTRLRAIDEVQFYGFYCLVFEDRETLRNLDSLRTNHSARAGGSNNLVDTVTSDDGRASQANQDVIDRITGHIRRRTNGPDEGSSAMSGSASSMGTDSHTASMRQAAPDDDPLRGLDF